MQDKEAKLFVPISVFQACLLFNGNSQARLSGASYCGKSLGKLLTLNEAWKCSSLLSSATGMQD
jgi:hypothetical protein